MSDEFKIVELVERIAFEGSIDECIEYYRLFKSRGKVVSIKPKELKYCNCNKSNGDDE